MTRSIPPADSLANRRFTVRGRYLFPCDRPPIPDACLTVENGRLVAVGSPLDSDVVDLGQVAILPGLVNPHTHLEFSCLETPLAPPNTAFPDWIRRVIAWRNQQTETSGSHDAWRHKAITAGIRESQSAGVTTLGEITTRPAPSEDFRVDVAGISFLELLGLRDESQAGLLEAAERFVELTRARSAGRPGISPHAPYTVSLTLLARIVELSARDHLPVAMHLAETRDELELLRHASGQLFELLANLGAWQADVIPLGTRPMDYLKSLASAHRSLVIHGNYLKRDEIEFVGQHRDRMSIVYCPRTHDYFGHKPYPLAEMLRTGVRVAIGTDSRASNPNLDLAGELRYVAEHNPWLAPHAIMRMGTIEAATALGLEDQVGSLTVGKSADFLLVPISDEKPEDPYELILNSTLPPCAVFHRGEQVSGLSIF